MFEETRVGMETIDRDQDMGGITKDWASTVIKWCRQLIEKDRIDHQESFVEDDPKSELLPLVTDFRKGKLEGDNELYLIKVKYGELKFRFALIDQKLTMKRVIWEIEQTWPSLKGQEIYLSWCLMERDQDGKCIDEDLNESLEYIELVDEQPVHRIVVMEIHLLNEEEGALADTQIETVRMSDGENL
jgi:hypothetical protein